MNSASSGNGKRPTRHLIAVCSTCKEPVSVRDVEKTSLTRLGRLIRRASQSRFDIQLVDNLPDSKCHCANPAPSERISQFSIRQMLFVTTILGLFMAIFRRPLSQILTESVWKSAVGPWTVIGNFFLGTEIIDPRPHFDKSVMSAVVFTISTPLAVLAVWFTFQGLCMWAYRLWLEVSDD